MHPESRRKLKGNLSDLSAGDSIPVHLIQLVQHLIKNRCIITQKTTILWMITVADAAI